MPLDDSKLFTRVADVETPVPMYILTQKIAPLQQGFYFVNASMTDDGRYLWFYCAFPPAGSGGCGKTLGAVDFKRQQVRHFPETQFLSASPFVDTVTGEVYWASGRSVWCRGPQADAEVRCVNSLPEEIVRQRVVTRLATHLTRSADGREFFIDAAFGVHWIMGSLPLDGGDFQLWHRFERNYNHAQFSPTDPDLALFAEEGHTDPITGLRFPIVDRMWLIRRGEAPEPVFSTPTRVTHEWWDVDGRHVWCVWGQAAWRTDIATRQVEKIEGPANFWHAHDSGDSKYLVYDSNERFYRGCPSAVYFLNRETGRHLHVVSNPEVKGIVGANYHIDPHPRFCCKNQYIVFTTTVRNQVDVALVKTADLITATQ